jgi:hypothetical protein
MSRWPPSSRCELHNGLLLSALWDAAFDHGLVSFADGAVLASPQLSEARARPGCRCIAAASRPQRRALSKSQDASRAPSIFGRGDFEAAPSYCREDLLSAVIHREAEIRDSAPGMVNVNQRGAGWPTVASRLTPPGCLPRAAFLAVEAVCQWSREPDHVLARRWTRRPSAQAQQLTLP